MAAQITTIPMLKDHHNHLSYYAQLHDCLKLDKVEDKAEALKLIEELPRDEVSVVLGWNSSFYHFSPQELAPLPPVLIVNLSLHSLLMSEACREILEPQFPEIIANYQDPKWFEYHMPEMLIFVANRVKVDVGRIKKFFRYMESRGVYWVEDMLLSSDEVYEIISHSEYKSRTSFWTTPENYKKLKPSTRAAVHGLKLFTDGAVGARTAALEERFLGGEEGYLLYDDRQLLSQLTDAAATGKAVAIHAIGERATAQTVNLIKELAARKIRFPEVRLEHCQFMSKEIAMEAKELGMVISMQPNFITDSTMYADRLSLRYLQWNCPFRMLIDEAGFIPGKDLILGSDGMPHGVEAALTASLFPPYPGQKLSLEEFVAGYCMPDFSTGEIELAITEDDVTIIDCRLH